MRAGSCDWAVPGEQSSDGTPKKYSMGLDVISRYIAVLEHFVIDVEILRLGISVETDSCCVERPTASLYKERPLVLDPT
jgi:hypothetical protein